jgi:hypothetical protein
VIQQDHAVIILFRPIDLAQKAPHGGTVEPIARFGGRELQSLGVTARGGRVVQQQRVQISEFRVACRSLAGCARGRFVQATESLDGGGGRRQIARLECGAYIGARCRECGRLAACRWSGSVT